MPNTWITADLHLGHKNIVEKHGRPFKTIEEHDEAIVSNFNEVVRPNDVVIFAGDVVFPQTGFDSLAKLHGNKTLLFGNHERHKLELYLKHFKKVRTEKLFKNMIVTHIPIHQGQFKRFGTNVHGHLHSHEIMLSALYPDPRYLCVSLEHTNYYPISLEDAKKKIADRCKNIPVEFFGVSLTIGGDHGAS